MPLLEIHASSNSTSTENTLSFVTHREHLFKGAATMYTNTRSCPPGFPKLGEISPDRVPLPAGVHENAFISVYTAKYAQEYAPWLRRHGPDFHQRGTQFI